MILSIWLFENQFVNIVSISFTALVLNELLMVALEINTWHRFMILSEIVTLFVYVGSMVFLPTYFGKATPPLHASLPLIHCMYTRQLS
jgi:phospholipid-translocating ATPase